MSTVKLDPITLERIDLIHPNRRAELHLIYKEICERLSGSAMCRFAYTLRTFIEQDALFAQGRTKPGKIVTKARAGRSYHNYGLAVDIVLLKDKDGNGTYETASWETNVDFDGDGVADWQEVVQVFKEYGWFWGGDWTRFPDMPHFEKPDGRTVAGLEEAYKRKLFIPGTQYLQL